MPPAPFVAEIRRGHSKGEVLAVLDTRPQSVQELLDLVSAGQPGLLTFEGFTLMPSTPGEALADGVYVLSRPRQVPGWLAPLMITLAGGACFVYDAMTGATVLASSVDGISKPLHRIAGAFQDLVHMVPHIR